MTEEIIMKGHITEEMIGENRGSPRHNEEETKYHASTLLKKLQRKGISLKKL